MSSFGASSTDAEFLDIVRMNCQNQQQDFRDGVLGGMTAYLQTLLEERILPFPLALEWHGAIRPGFVLRGESLGPGMSGGLSTGDAREKSS